jgi:transcriptional regulator with XRE-family HTH domain
VPSDKPDAAFVENLRRLLAFHFRSNREAAKALGVTEHAVGLWLNGKRRPGAEALIAIDRTLGVSPRDFDITRWTSRSR